jgi:hypothetical protein
MTAGTSEQTRHPCSRPTGAGSLGQTERALSGEEQGEPDALVGDGGSKESGGHSHRALVDWTTVLESKKLMSEETL